MNLHKLEIYNSIMASVNVFNATFNTISVISWRSGLLVEESGVPGKKPSPACLNKNADIELSAHDAFLQ